MESFRSESMDENGIVHIHSTTNDTDACITVLDLTTLPEGKDARGFKRGFVGYPYIYLSPGEFTVIARLNMENFHLETVNLLNLNDYNIKLGGFSGGFVDGTWACFK